MRSTPPIQIGRIGRMGIYQQRFSVIAMSPTLWLDAADELSIKENSGGVWQWDDKSGNGNHLAQATASNQPTTGVTAINSKNTVSFDGISDHLYSTSPFMYNAGNVTVFTVHKAPAQLDQRTMSESSAIDSDPIYALLASGGQNTSYDKVFIRADSGSVLVSGAQEFSTVYYNNSPVISTITDTGSEISAYANGIIGTPNTISYTRSSSLTLNRFCIGALLRSNIFC